MWFTFIDSASEVNVKTEAALAVLRGYREELSGILSRILDAGHGIHISDEDDKRYRDIAREIKDFAADEMTDNRNTSFLLVRVFNDSVSTATGKPGYKGVETFSEALDALIERIERSPMILRSNIGRKAETASATPPIPSPVADAGDFANLNRIANRFHLMVRQMRERHEGRAAFEVEDEFDVQDLFRSLLALYYDDIEQEQWMPDHADGQPVIDFFLPGNGVVVEIRKTRRGLAADELKALLAEDIEKYKQHDGCQHVFCCVYDPEARIPHPRDLEKALSDTQDDIDVIVNIVPRG